MSGFNSTAVAMLARFLLIVDVCLSRRRRHTRCALVTGVQTCALPICDMSLLWQIERHLKETGTPPTLLGRRAVRDPRLVHDLRRGRQPGQRMERRVLAFINSHNKEATKCDR